MTSDRSRSQTHRVVVAGRPDRLVSLLAIADDYIEHHRPRAARELSSFRSLSSDGTAISRAALGQMADGRRHPHQYRVHTDALWESRRRLLEIAPALAGAASFDELFDLVSSEIEMIDGIGELAVYDAALRIGARFDLQPTRVYLHAGTRTGAKALGLPHRNACLDHAELPTELQVLTAREAEDALCIYKQAFTSAVGRTRVTSRCSA